MQTGGSRTLTSHIFGGLGQKDPRIWMRGSSSLIGQVRLSAYLSPVEGTDQGFPLLSLSLGFGGFCCGLSFLSGVTTLLGSLGGRLSSSRFWANAPADTMPNITTAQSFRVNFFIFQPKPPYATSSA